MKKKIFLKLILDYFAFGEPEAYSWTQEWKKRLLPHLHVLLTLKRNSKLLTVEDIDKIITAEIANGTDINSIRLKKIQLAHLN